MLLGYSAKVRVNLISTFVGVGSCAFMWVMVIWACASMCRHSTCLSTILNMSINGKFSLLSENWPTYVGYHMCYTTGRLCLVIINLVVVGNSAWNLWLRRVRLTFEQQQTVQWKLPWPLVCGRRDAAGPRSVAKLRDWTCVRYPSKGVVKRNNSLVVGCWP